MASTMTGDFDSALTAAGSRRMSNQLARAYGGTYGARTGLRIIVLSLARQMLRSGTTPEAAAQAFERCVLDHPLRSFGDAQNVMTGAAHSQMLIDLTRECVAVAARECATSNGVIG